ncbi:MAG: efflux transporter periplasmic adaptor subunit [Panacagrimonas sp.]|nr:efflux RND transporter periplasmic adaptor subunit [Panacagrimonas sp.]MCC2657406.1 efflux transporter periplasmic adaptor subunit [Panacagrimonas sp.]
MKDDKSALLGSLKIERGTEDASPGGPRRRHLLLIAAGVLIAALAIVLATRDRTVSVRTVVARTPGAEAGSVLDASGYVVARRRATVSSKVTGKVVELLIEEGSRVEEGQVLARIDDSNLKAQLELARSQLDAARSQLAEVQVQLVEADRNLSRTRELAGRKLLSQAALDNAQANRDTLRARIESTRRNVTVAERSVAVQQQQLDDTVVRAPFAGVITVKNAQPGEMISPLSAGGDGTRTGIGTLVDMDSLEVEVDVNENFINRVHAGQPAQSTLNAYPEWKIPSKVVAVIPTADRSKATVKVRIALELRDPRVLPDMGARVSFMPMPGQAPADDAPTGAALVNKSAIRTEDGTSSVFVVGDDQRVERRTVKLGKDTGADTEVLEGLRGGETLAASQLERLKDGTRITVAADE